MLPHIYSYQTEYLAPLRTRQYVPPLKANGSPLRSHVMLGVGKPITVYSRQLYVLFSGCSSVVILGAAEKEDGEV